MSIQPPEHVAIIMDGNGRWARAQGKPRVAGHRQGVETVRTVIKACTARGVSCLTLFAFSSENWRRPPTEVRLLLELLNTALENEVSKLHRNGVRLRVIGDLSAFPKRMQDSIRQAEELTAENTALFLQVAINYGGRWDIAEAAKTLARRVAAGEMSADDIDEEKLGQELATGNLPEPDLFIRTGGEVRMSNFLLWQLAYTELYFTELLWPDFGEAELDRAIESFSNRQRRFGQTGDQVVVQQASDA